jgi:hypothetical protein
MIPFKNLAIGSLCLTLSSLASYSQNARKIAFRTLCLGHAGEIRSVVVPGKAPDESTKVELYTDVSPVVEGSFTGGEATFFIEKAGAAGKPVRELVGKVPLGKSERQLFVFQPGTPGKDSLPYQVRAFDDDVKSFAMGSVRAINLSPVPVRFVLSGEVTPQIPPSKYAQFPHSKKVNNYNMYPVVIEFLSADGKWTKGQSVSWKSTERRREIVVTQVDPKFKQPSVRMFSDFPPWLDKPPVTEGASAR